LIAASWSGVAETTPPIDSTDCSNLALAGPALAEANPVSDERVDSPLTKTADGALCWIDLATLNGPGSSQPTWIDVRTSADARSAPIPGALTIRLVDLPTKTFLQNTPVVLIGSGRDDADLARACGELKRAGFQQVKLLRGGIRAWVNGQRAVLADAGVLQKLDLIQPSEFHRQAASAPWLVLAVDLNPADGLPVAMGTAERIDAGGDAVRATDAVRRRQAEIARMSAKERPNALVIVTRDEASATRLRDALRNGGGGDVLILQGGMAGYQAFLAQQQSIAAAAGKPLIRSCGSG
jgi:rhodanese-related sulfurtransferase